LWEPGRLKQSDPKLKEFLVAQFSDAAIEAFKNRAPARAGFRAGELKGATRNRQQGNDLVDPQVGVLRVEARDRRKTIATLFNFTGHPVVIGSNNLLLSGEYPGAACRAVENLLGGVAIFTQGAAGDVTVHRQGDPFDEIERIGRTLAGEVIKTSGFIECRDELPLAGASKLLSFSPREIPSIEEAQNALDAAKKQLESAEKTNGNPDFRRQLQQQVQLQTVNLKVAMGKKDGTLKLPDAYEAEVQVLQAGDLVLVAIPGEIFVEYALEMRSRVRQAVDKDMILAGYSNGYIGYIITPRAARTGGYEASVARVGPDAGRSLTETAMGLLGELSEGPQKKK
jgi:hypothetical protein